MDLQSLIEMVPACHGPLEPSLLTSKEEWRNFYIAVCLEEELEEKLDQVMCDCVRKESVTMMWMISTNG